MHGIEPSLGAALIRQESSFFTTATSAARALAADKAGEARVDRWARKVGTSDSEVFVARIPYVETRDYVRLALRNMTWYLRLHAL